MSALGLACQRGDVAAVRALLNAGEGRSGGVAGVAQALCSGAGAGGNTPLHYACIFDEVEVLRLLLAYRAAPGAGAGAGDTAVDAVGHPNANGLVCTHHAAASNAMAALRLLLAEPRTLELRDARNRWGETPLHLAAAAGHTSAVRALLGAGSPPALVDQWGRTAFQVAREQGETASTKVFEELGADVVGEATASSGVVDHTLAPHQAGLQSEFLRALAARTAKLGSAAAEPAPVTVKHLFRGPTDCPEATAASAPATAVTVPEHGASIPVAQSSTCTPDAVAGPGQRRRALSKLVEYPGDPEAVQAMLADAGVDPLGADMYGWTALHKFCSWNRVELVQLVLAHPEARLRDAANLVGRNPEGYTPAHSCVDMGAHGALAVLLEGTPATARPRLDVADKKGRTPLALARELGDTHAERLLTEAEAEAACRH